MVDVIDRLIQENEDNKDAVESAQKLISTLIELVRKYKGNEAKLEKIVDEWDTRNKELAQSVTAGTPFEESGNE